MGRTRFDKYLVGDFETTVYEGQDHTEVWASALVEMYTEDVHIFGNIDETLEYLADMACNVCVYYHNLKFDGGFWVWWLLDHGFKTDCYNRQNGERIKDTRDLIDNPTRRDNVLFYQNGKMHEKSFKYNVSHLGQWYSITIKYKHHIIQLRDSLKLLPFSVSKIGKDFKTKHKKLNMDYEGYRFSGCWISPEEREYIANDVLVVKEALEIMFNEGHSSLTIGTCCMNEYKNKDFPYPLEMWKHTFPDLTKIELPVTEDGTAIYGAKNVDEYVRKAYKGGWCYLVQGKERRIYQNGVTADVNSLYPSMMHSMSGNYYPVGTPTFTNDAAFIDKHIVRWCKSNDYYFFIRIKCRFYLKTGKLPTIQIKNNPLYNPTEWLVTSDVYNEEYDEYTKRVAFGDSVFDCRVELTLTKTDFILFQEHYDVRDLEFLDVAVFSTEIGLFDHYIDKYAKIKQTSTGALRQQAKLFLNNLYGKFATSDDSSFKFAYMKHDESVGYFECEAHEKSTVYIPVGAVITSYARNFTIRAAQKNFHGINKPGFIYADTDSIHCDLPADQLQGIEVHDTAFCCWKLEASWDQAFFVRQKTYAEHVIAKDLKPIEKPYYNLKAAGMPESCKNLFKMSMLDPTDEQLRGRFANWDNLTDEQKNYFRKTEKKTAEDWRAELGDNWDKMPEKERDFVTAQKREIDDFDLGLVVPGKLMPQSIKGGILLVKTTFEMR